MDKSIFLPDFVILDMKVDKDFLLYWDDLSFVLVIFLLRLGLVN